jgi:hypothetical protein
MQDTVSRSSGNVSWSDDRQRLAVQWTGNFRLSQDETDIEWVENGATVTISDGKDVVNRVELRGTANGITRRYWRGGASRDYEPEGRQVLAAAIDKLIRHSGLFAKERVAKYLKSGGPDAVLAQIDRLADSSYVRRVYYSELLRQATPTDALLTRVLQRVPNELTSDYDKSTLLTLAAGQPAITDTHRATIARAATTIGSDYEQRRALTAVLNTKPLSSALASAVLEATASIDSNYDRSTVLVTVIEHGGLTSATAPVFMEQVRTMSSSYDQRRVLVAMTAQDMMQNTVRLEALRAARAMTSAHDLSTTLIGLIERGGLTDATAQDFFESAGHISSAHELSRVLRKVLDQPSITERLMEGVLRTAPKVTSSHERANVLVDAAARGPLAPAARQLYVAASQGLGRNDEDRVLAALVRGEARR